MKYAPIWLLILTLLAAGGGYYIWQLNQETTEPAAVAVAPQPLELPEEPLEPEIKFPVPEAPIQIDTQVSPPIEAVEEDEPLPLLGESDHTMEEEFSRLFDPSFLKLFIFKAFIHRVVVTVDNLTATKLPKKFRLTTPPPDAFMVNKNAQGKMFIDPKNYRRYAAYVNFFEAIDTNALAAKYVRYYPLFQQAYEALGYPDGYFNDRLIEVIDHLLEAPDILVPVELIRPNVFYQYADPRLEALSAGQKILVRIGYDNEFRVKSKLRELRRELTTLQLDLR